MSEKYPFGMEAMNPLLEALGLPVDETNRHYVYLNMAIHIAHDRFPHIELRIAPDSAFWDDPHVKETLSKMQLYIDKAGILEGDDTAGMQP